MDGEYRSRWLEAIPKRYSERNFNNIPISSGDECVIMECCALLSAMFEEVRLEYIPLDSGKAFSGLGRLISKINGARGLAAIIARKDCEIRRQLAGMAGERFILECTDCGLKTCWIGGSYNPAEVKRHISLTNSEELLAVCAIGYSDRPAPERRRLKLEQLCSAPLSELPDFAVQAMECARLAPSSLNRQPWKFEAGRDFLEIRLDSKGLCARKMQLIDLGIAASHADIYLNSVLNETEMKIYEDRVVFRFEEAEA